MAILVRKMVEARVEALVPGINPGTASISQLSVFLIEEDQHDGDEVFDSWFEVAGALQAAERGADRSERAVIQLIWRLIHIHAMHFQIVAIPDGKQSCRHCRVQLQGTSPLGSVLGTIRMDKNFPNDAKFHFAQAHSPSGCYRSIGRLGTVVKLGKLPRCFFHPRYRSSPELMRFHPGVDRVEPHGPPCSSPYISMGKATLS
jgi:hypothetical protein